MNIDEILRKLMLDKASEEEIALLESWKKENRQNADFITALMDQANCYLESLLG